MTSPKIPIAVPLLLTGNIKNILVCNKGIIIPAPEPWNIRPINNNVNEGAIAASPVPKANKPIAVINNLRSEEHTSELQSRGHLVCRLLLEKKKIDIRSQT